MSFRLRGSFSLPGALVALLLMSGGAVFGQSPGGNGRYLVEFRTPGSHAAIVRAAGGSPVHDFPEYGTVAAWLPEPAIRALQRNPNVQFIEEDPKRYPSAQTTPYGITMVQADQVSDSLAANRKVCIIDSGFYAAHEDLSGNSVNGTNDSGTGNWFEDRCGHGTHVAGTVAAVNNTVGVIGVLPNKKIALHIIKVFGDDCVWAYSSDLVAALRKCRDAGSNVVSMSLGGSFKSGLEDRAFKDAYANGVLSVAAAGNAGDASISYPAGYGSVVSVAAVDSNKLVADFSQKNSDVELAAPGVNVLSTVPYNETNTLTVDGVTYQGTWIENAARTTGTSGALADGSRCSSTGAWSGKVVLCERGDISFFEKVMNVQNSGGVAAVIYNNVSGGFSGTLGDGNSSTIPAIGISQEDGQFLAANKIGVSGTVVSTRVEPASGYDFFSGTSMATPHASGVAALVWSHFPTKTNADIRKALQDSAEDLGAAGRDNSYGFGLVRAKAAFDLLSGGGGGGCTVTPLSCTDGVDNDCDGLIDEADECTSSCKASGSSCTSNSECCSGNCKGKPGAKTCK